MRIYVTCPRSKPALETKKFLGKTKPRISETITIASGRKIIFASHGSTSPVNAGDNAQIAAPVANDAPNDNVRFVIILPNVLSPASPAEGVAGIPDVVKIMVIHQNSST